MAINRVEIKDFLVFKGEFAADFCPGVNVLIGGNGTGKTTLMKVIYAICEATAAQMFSSGGWFDYFSGTRPGYHYVFNFNDFGKIQIFSDGIAFGWIAERDEIKKFIDKSFIDDAAQILPIFISGPHESINLKTVFIPSYDMLSHSLGFLALNNKRETSFDKTFIDIVSNAELSETKNISQICQKLCREISKIIDGEVLYQNDTFYIKKSSGQLVEFSFEASGYRKFGLLWKLLRNGLLESGTTLFWDEPENSLNPELVPVLVDVLLELSQCGVQIFLATHSEVLSSYFDVLRGNNDKIMFFSLYKGDSGIKYDRSERFDLLTPNSLTAEQARLYEREVERGLGNEN